MDQQIGARHFLYHMGEAIRFLVSCHIYVLKVDNIAFNPILIRLEKMAFKYVHCIPVLLDPNVCLD